MIKEIMDYTEKIQGSSGLGLNEFVEALEVEKQKIQVFQKELPLSFELVTQAIERCKQQLSGTAVECLQGQSEWSQQISSEEHAFEEFIPMKRTSSFDNDEEDDEEHSNKPKTNSKEKKSDWLRSVQLWNPNPDPPVKEEMPRKAKVELKKNGGAFQPFQREKIVEKTNGFVAKAPPSAPATSSSARTVSEGNGGSVKKEEKESQSQRKQRRNWSPELHRRFLNALQQLGGTHAATPKQIRDLMKIDGLTNDEVKSHLQKYRLHNRRPNAAIHNNSNAQTPQFVVVGGLWVSSPDYATIATTTTTTTVEPSNVGQAIGIYAPVAQPKHKITQEVGSVIQKQQLKHSESSHSDERASSSHSEREVHSNSSATSSSTHITTS